MKLSLAALKAFKKHFLKVSKLFLGLEVLKLRASLGKVLTAFWKFSLMFLKGLKFVFLE